MSSRKMSWWTLRRTKQLRTAVSWWRGIKGDVWGVVVEGGISYTGGNDDDDGREVELFNISVSVSSCEVFRSQQADCAGGGWPD